MELFYIQLNLRNWENPKGAFRMPPNRVLPGPLSVTPPGGSYGGGRTLLLAFSKLLLVEGTTLF